MITNRFLSLGWGVQSFTLAAMAALSEIPPFVAVIHVDTTHERAATYAFAAAWSDWLTTHGARLITVPADTPHVLRKGGVAIPAYTTGGMLGRQCTKAWKIDPARRVIRSVLHEMRITIHRQHAEIALGISTDESYRVRPSRVNYLSNVYPLLDLRMSRDDCKRWLTAHELPVPPRSHCTFCPYQSRSEWLDILAHPTDRTEALATDDAIRHHAPPGDIYLSSERRPLTAIQAQPDPTHQLPLWQNECDGYCNL